MPFDFKAYDAKCNGLTPEELQREWEHYTRLISGASTSTAISGIAVPFTLGVSTIGIAMAAPAIHNARKKREIIERHLQKYGMTHLTRKRDVLGSMAVSGTIGVVTLGVGTAGADAIATAGAEHGISAIVENDTAIKVVTHAALDGHFKLLVFSKLCRMQNQRNITTTLNHNHNNNMNPFTSSRHNITRLFKANQGSQLALLRLNHLYMRQLR
ncbi:hypothetical protein ColTof3_01303 [Colletotrichum tofieldiae]|nr:hypothetical protein ColTof3_01303 [Colletotrichum tofieldiae]